MRRAGRLRLTGRSPPGAPAATRVAAVIGSPVRHSLSPTLLNAAFAATGLDWVYVAFEVPEGAGAAAVAAMRTLGLGGLSVTMPHKAAALRGGRRADARGRRRARGRELRVRPGRDASSATTPTAPGFVDALRAGRGRRPGRPALRAARRGRGRAGRGPGPGRGGRGRGGGASTGRPTRPRRAADAGRTRRAGSATAADVAAADLVVNATSLGMAGGAGEPAAPRWTPTSSARARSSSTSSTTRRRPRSSPRPAARGATAVERPRHARPPGGPRLRPLDGRAASAPTR